MLLHTLLWKLKLSLIAAARQLRKEKRRVELFSLLWRAKWGGGDLGEQQQLSFNKKYLFFSVQKHPCSLSHAHDLLLFSPTRTAAERWREKATAFENITFCLFCSLFYENLHMWCWCTTTQLRDDILVIESLGGKNVEHVACRWTSSCLASKSPFFDLLSFPDNRVLYIAEEIQISPIWELLSSTST